MGSALTIQLNQWTAGPISNVSVLFGDGSPPETYNITAGLRKNITYSYTTPGIFTISVNATPIGLTGVTVTVNTITVNVGLLSSYTGKFN
jgi:hypothetical protein